MTLKQKIGLFFFIGGLVAIETAAIVGIPYFFAYLGWSKLVGVVFVFFANVSASVGLALTKTRPRN